VSHVASSCWREQVVSTIDRQGKKVRKQVSVSTVHDRKQMPRGLSSVGRGIMSFLFVLVDLSD
jgi:hypothetical protein